MSQPASGDVPVPPEPPGAVEAAPALPPPAPSPKATRGGKRAAAPATPSLVVGDYVAETTVLHADVLQIDEDLSHGQVHVPPCAATSPSHFHPSWVGWVCGEVVSPSAPGLAWDSRLCLTRTCA